MPVVIKRDEPNKNPKAGGSTAKAAAAKAAPKAAAKSTSKPAPATKGKKGAKAERSETPKLVILATVTVLALGFLLWYFVFAGSGNDTTVPVAGDQTDRPPTNLTVPGATGNQTTTPRVGGFSTGDEAAPAGSGLGRSTEGKDDGGEGIP